MPTFRSVSEPDAVGSNQPSAQTQLSMDTSIQDDFMDDDSADDDDDISDNISESAPDTNQEQEGWWVDHYMPIIQHHIYTAKTNPRHHYINFSILGRTLSTEVIMYHLEQILSAYSKLGHLLFVQPQLGFFLYNHSKNGIDKYFYASANTAIFRNYRLLSVKTLKRIENYVKSLAVKDFPYALKSLANERSNVGFTLVTNVVYSLIVV